MRATTITPFVVASLCASLCATAAPVVYRAAAIHTVSGESFAPGELLVDGGKLRAVGKTVPRAAAAKVVDLAGLQLYPGLIAAPTSLGLAEISGVRATVDTTEVGEFVPDVEAWISVNPDSELIPVARANGITHALVAPMGGRVSGVSGLMQLNGWGVEQMTIQKPVALHLWWPAMQLDTTPKEQLADASKSKSLKEQASERAERLRAIDRFFDDADAYQKARATGAKDFKKVPAWESVLPFLKGERPIMVHATEARQITAAVTWAQKRHYKIVLVGAQDAWRVAELLGKHAVPVIYDATFELPRRDDDAHDIHFRAPHILHRAGVPIALCLPMGGWAASELRNLPYLAAQSAAHGLPRAEALKAITLRPAQFMGVADRLGSLEADKEATFIAVDGDLLDIRANVKRVWIAGEEVSLESRHTRLFERYKNRPRPRP